HILSMDDRVECPQSVRVNVINPNHPILKGIDGQWPRFMGYSRSIAKNDAETIMTINEDPFLVTESFGKGRSIAFASSPGPHWGGMKEYLTWHHHDLFWQHCMLWASGELT
ncbi:MAG: glutamine amidotransferase, partial [Sphaerochaetaceae bacterium]